MVSISLIVYQCFSRYSIINSRVLIFYTELHSRFLLFFFFVNRLVANVENLEQRLETWVLRSVVQLLHTVKGDSTDFMFRMQTQV